MAFETLVFSQCPLNQYPIEVPPYTIKLTFTELPIVPWENLNLNHATSTPDTTYPEASYPISLSWMNRKHPVLMSQIISFSTLYRWFIFIRLSSSHLAEFFHSAFLNAHDQSSLLQPLEVVWNQRLVSDSGGPTAISLIASLWHTPKSAVNSPQFILRSRSWLYYPMLLVTEFHWVFE